MVMATGIAILIIGLVLAGIAESVIPLALAFFLAIGVNFMTIDGYSEGSRTGTVTKFSKKGILLKTYEGNLMIGETAGTVFRFSVVDKSIIKDLQDLAGKKVTLEYRQHYVVAANKGATNYLITKVTPL